MRRLALAVACLAAAVAPAAGEDDDEASLLIGDARDALDERDLDEAATLLDRALAVDPRRIDAYVLRGSVHVARKEFPAAISLLNRARELAPRNLDVLETLGGAEVLGGKADEGLARLEKVVAGAPTRFKAHSVLGTTYVRRGDWARAERSLKAYLATRPKALAVADLRYRLDLANATLRVDRAAEARAQFAAIVKERPKNVEARLGRAWATAATDCDDAMPLLRDLGELADRYPEILDVHGRCALLLGASGEAITVAERYRGLRPKRAEPYALLGEARAGKGDTKGAMEALTRAVELAPDQPLFSLKLARVERLAGRAQTAVQRLRNAGAPAGFDDAWTLELGLATYDTADPAMTRTTLEPLVARKPELVAARATLGMALVDLGELSPGIDHLRKAVAAGENGPRPKASLVRALNLSAVAAFGTGDRARAEAELVAASEVADDPITWRNLGGVRLEGGDAAGALAALQKAGAEPTASYLRGRALAALGRWDDAATAYRAAAKQPVDPAFAADVAIELALALRQLGQLEDAVATVERGLTGADKETTARVREAYLATVQAAASDALADGRYAVALRLLEGARPRLDATTSEAVRIGLDCDLALAASAVGRRERALELLRPLARKKASCPFAPPADGLAIEILIAWNEGVGRKAKASMTRLDGMRARATGPAAGLLNLAARDVALRAAVESFERGDLRGARGFLDDARRYDRQSDEIAHNLAVLDIHLGNFDRAAPVLEQLSGAVPEALINLGIAREAQGRSKDALAAWERARAARVRHPQLEAWITSKQRFWGAP